jgi:hypothetical protein
MRAGADFMAGLDAIGDEPVLPSTAFEASNPTRSRSAKANGHSAAPRARRTKSPKRRKVS